MTTTAIEHDDDHADEHDDDHGDEHDDDHADEHDDDHDDEHDDDHADEHDDDHADEHDDDHADEHDDDHADEHDDDHGDEHDDDHDHEMAVEVDCDAHDAEVAALIGEQAASREHIAVLGRAKDIECQAHHHGEEHGHGEHEDDEGACDPHMWMDPHNVIYWALMIRDSLSALDHDNEEAYAANAAAYAEELVALEADFITPALDELPEEKRLLITGHESMGYFVTTYGFEIISTVLPGLSTLVEPSARDVATLIDVIRDEGVPAIFSDAHLSDVLVNMIGGETGVAVVSLHSDSLSDSSGPAATYLEYMRYNVTAIVDALKGDWR